MKLFYPFYYSKGKKKGEAIFYLFLRVSLQSSNKGYPFVGTKIATRIRIPWVARKKKGHLVSLLVSLLRKKDTGWYFARSKSYSLEKRLFSKGHLVFFRKKGDLTCFPLITQGIRIFLLKQVSLLVLCIN